MSSFNEEALLDVYIGLLQVLSKDILSAKKNQKNLKNAILILGSDKLLTSIQKQI